VTLFQFSFLICHSAGFAVRALPPRPLAPQLRRFANQPSNESFITGTSINYVENMHESWLKDPNSVHVSWRTYFSALQAGHTGQIASLPPALQGGVAQQAVASGAGGGGVHAVDDLMRALLLVRSYEMRGHNIAKVDAMYSASAVFLWIIYSRRLTPSTSASTISTLMRPPSGTSGSSRWRTRSRDHTPVCNRVGSWTYRIMVSPKLI
jgi:hypothetical protein